MYDPEKPNPFDDRMVDYKNLLYIVNNMRKLLYSNYPKHSSILNKLNDLENELNKFCS